MKPPYIPSSPVIDGKVNPYENSMVIYTFPSMTGDDYKIYKGHQGTRWVFGYPVELQLGRLYWLGDTKLLQQTSSNAGPGKFGMHDVR